MEALKGQLRVQGALAAKMSAELGVVTRPHRRAPWCWSPLTPHKMFVGELGEQGTHDAMPACPSACVGPLTRCIVAWQCLPMLAFPRKAGQAVL